MMETKRLACTRCLRPQRTCICQWIVPTAHATEVLFLQHPLEAGNAKNSAGLLHLSLKHSQLAIGETFGEDMLHALLLAPFPTEDAAVPQDGVIHPILLYPADADDDGATLRQNVPPHLTARHRLVVLDATWRKSRKMLHLNPMLQQLPRLALHNPPASHYAIRKAHRPHQLSTFEATCHALAQLENADEKYLPLLAAFDGFVMQQQQQQSQAIASRLRD